MPTSQISSLACIDLSSPDLLTSASLVRQASLDCGFFYVINHGISEEFLEEVFEQSKKFFELPQEEKMKYLRNKKHRGYTPFLDEILDPGNQTKVPVTVEVGSMWGTVSLIPKNSFWDCKEGFYLGVEVADDDPQAVKQFYGPNIWPPAGRTVTTGL
eukprot:Gb_22950 [translate_table: standard]